MKTGSVQYLTPKKHAPQQKASEKPNQFKANQKDHLNDNKKADTKQKDQVKGTGYSQNVAQSNSSVQSNQSKQFEYKSPNPHPGPIDKLKSSEKKLSDIGSGDDMSPLKINLKLDNIMETRQGNQDNQDDQSSASDKTENLSGFLKDEADAAKDDPNFGENDLLGSIILKIKEVQMLYDSQDDFNISGRKPTPIDYMLDYPQGNTSQHRSNIFEKSGINVVTSLSFALLIYFVFIPSTIRQTPPSFSRHQKSLILTPVQTIQLFAFLLKRPY